jgi:hypothetical protein
MILFCRILFFSLLFEVYGCVLAQTSLPADPEEYIILKLKPFKMNLGIKEPENWVGDLVKAGEMYANVLFYQSEKSFKSGGVLIKVIVYTKQDENTLADLDYQIKTFKKEYKNAKIEDFTIKHSEYPCFSNLLFVKKKRYEYITYVNPGREYKAGVLITMRTKKRPANIQEMRIYDEIIRSLHVSPIEDKSIVPPSSSSYSNEPPMPQHHSIELPVGDSK